MSCAVEVAQGDATEIRGVPALVVPANKQLTLSWGSHLAEKVRALAGPAAEQEALAAKPDGLELGEAVLTSAGAMEGFSHLVHAAVLDKYDFNPLFLLRLRERTSERTLRGATRASLDLAVGAGLSGLVFTPMGAGIGGMSMAKCARIMLEEIRAFPGGLERVVIACLKERAAEVFRREAEGA